MPNLPPILTLTDRAVDHVRSLLARADRPVSGLRISVRRHGCSGLGYIAEYVETPSPDEEAIPTAGGMVYVPRSVSLFLVGTEIDYEETDFQSGFVFRNPNEVGRCGCGESFTTED